MTNTGNNLVNYERFGIDEITGGNSKEATPAWKELIEAGEFISRGNLLIVNGKNVWDASFAAESGYDVTLIDQCGNDNILIDELLQANPDIKYIKQDIFSLSRAHFAKFDFIYETACSLFIQQDRKNYLKQICEFIKPGGRLITIFQVSNKNIKVEYAGIDPVQFHKDADDYVKLELSSKYLVSPGEEKKEEVLQIYYKPVSQLKK